MKENMFLVYLLGEQGVGKLSLVESLLGIHHRYVSRKGVDAYKKIFTVNEEEIELMIFHNHYPCYSPKHILRNPNFVSHGLILVYDITNEQSLYKLGGWIDPCLERVKELDIQMVFAGCKADLDERRSVSKEDALEFTKDLDLQIDDVIECSAKTRENVEEVFLVLISRMLNRFKK